MYRPFIFKILPLRLQLSVFYRWYYPVAKRWYHLFDAAPLRFAPKVKLKQLIPTDSKHGSIAFTGVYEYKLSRSILKTSGKGGVMIDVGANIGYFSLIWAASNPNNSCIAFEASPRNIKLMQHNIESNSLENRIKLYEFAAGKEDGIAEFSVGPEEQTGWGGLSLEPSDNTIQVIVKRIDNIISQKEIIDVLKIDVEGADTWVLMGCEKLLKEKRIKEIYYEQNKSRMLQLGIQENEAINFLRSVGYETMPFHSQEWKAVPKR